jgi:hypothetical protein
MSANPTPNALTFRKRGVRMAGALALVMIVTGFHFTLFQCNQMPVLSAVTAAFAVGSLVVAVSYFSHPGFTNKVLGLAG